MKVFRTTEMKPRFEPPLGKANSAGNFVENVEICIRRKI